jgi:hypothetical protein
MKKTVLTISLLVSLLIAPTLHAQLLYEPFDTTGSVAGTRGWVAHSGTTGFVTYQTTPSDNGNSLSYSGFPVTIGNRASITAAGVEDINKALGVSITDSMYVSFLLKVLNTTSLQASGTLGNYFFHLLPQAGASVGTVFPCRVHIRQGNAPNTFNLGVINQSGGTISPSAVYGDSVNFPINQTVLVVVKYNRVTNVATLWINPPTGQLIEPTPRVVCSVGTSAAPALLTAIAIRQSNASGVGTGDLELDEIRVSQVWGDVSLPVELTGFTGAFVNNRVELVWSTASEQNNRGFSIERRRITETDWQSVGFVAGNGTTAQPKTYRFADNTAALGQTLAYRLKQTDYDGKFAYSPVVEVKAVLPTVFALQQNYPNPFNPSTQIRYQVPMSNEVTLEVFDMLGRKVSTLVNQRQEAGAYSVNFDATSFASGVYFYRLQAGNFVEMKKMMLVR